MPKRNSASVNQEALKALQQRGHTSSVLEARLAYAEASQLINHYLEPMTHAHRVYPNMTSPQASGRLSVSNPPLINFTVDPKYGPHGIQDVVIPDPGEQWICWDLEAVEARLIAHVTEDPVDRETFKRGLDIHTVTGIKMLRWPDPPFEPTKQALFNGAGEEWCARVPVPNPPYHEKHPYRTLFKNVRYTGQYCKHKRAAAVYAVDLGMTRAELEHFQGLYLQSKPQLVAWKRQAWAECWRTHESRTAFGRRRRLVGSRDQVEKEGLNHRIQGTVADMIDRKSTRLNSSHIQKSRMPSSA